MLLPSISVAWNAYGHQLIKNITWHYLNSSVKDSLLKYNSAFSSIQSHSTQLSSGSSIQSACQPLQLEADHIRVITPASQVISKIELLVYSLKNRNQSKSQICDYINQLVVLVADLHEPCRMPNADSIIGSKHLHLMSGREETLLHVWENLFLRPDKISYASCLSIQLNKGSWQKYYPNSIPQTNQKLKPISLHSGDWQLTSESVLQYINLPGDASFDESYFDKCTPILLLQLHNAGQNLALLLKSIFI
ncbi:MAG: hypothetical protein JNK73_13400 [Bacteroidia bacterium]|nr:hypothetical protein [Bacteroidia bacterium]